MISRYRSGKSNGVCVEMSAGAIARLSQRQQSWIRPETVRSGSAICPVGCSGQNQRAMGEASVCDCSIHPVPASFPAVKLQGIFFRLKNPEAMVNGKTVRVGESVLGAKVTRIDRREVVVEWNGQSKTLSLDGL